MARFRARKVISSLGIFEDATYWRKRYFKIWKGIHGHYYDVNDGGLYYHDGSIEKYMATKRNHNFECRLFSRQSCYSDHG